MAGEVRPASLTNFQQENPKKLRTENAKKEGSPPPTEEPSSHPFPDLLYSSTGIEGATSARISKVPKDIKTLIEALEADKLQVDELGAAEIVATFYATKEVQAMGTLLPAQPSGCQNYISRYFALEQKGAPHVKSLKSQISAQDIRYDQIPLLRFLPFCTNLQRLKVSIDITDMEPFAEILHSLAAILKRHEPLKEFKLVLSNRTRRVLNIEKTWSLGDLLSVLLDLPNMETVQINSLAPQIDMLQNAFDNFFHASKKDLILRKNRCKVLLIDSPRIELHKYLTRAELDECIGAFQDILRDSERETEGKVSPKAMEDLRPFISEIGDISNVTLREINIYYVDAKGTIQSGFWKNYRGLDFSRLGFPPFNIQHGYLSVMVERPTQK